MLADGKYFKVADLACRDGTPYPEEFADRLPALMELLDTIREDWGSPIVIVSGYRSPAHNQALVERDQEIGSHQVASGSQHVEGRAADIRPEHGDLAAFWWHVEDLLAEGKLPMLGGFALYPESGWVDVDTRPRPASGRVATWKGV